MRIRRRLLRLELGLALLCGCAVGPNFERPQAPAEAAYTATPVPEQMAPSTGESAQRIQTQLAVSARWWELFRSPELDDVVGRALDGNHDLASARATLEQAREGITAARGALYPQLDADALVQRQRNPGLSTGSVQGRSNTSNLYSVGGVVSYAVDVFGGVRRRVEQQSALAELSQRELQAAWLTLAGDAVTQSILIASLRAQIDAVEDVISDDLHSFTLVQRKFDAGKVARSDVLTAQTQLASDRVQLPPLRQQLDAAEHALSVLTGASPASWSPPDFELTDFSLPEDVPLTLPSELVRQRPDILAAEADLHAASAAIGVATAQLFPSLTLSGSIDEVALSAGSLFSGSGTAWALASQVAAPIFHGGTLRANRRAAIDAYDASLSSYQQTVLEAFRQVADALRALEHDAELVDAQHQLLDAAEHALAIQRVSYVAGKIDLLDLLDAQRSYGQARLGFARAQAQRLSDTALLFVALGGGALDSGI